MEHSIFSWFELAIGLLGVFALFLIFFTLVALTFIKNKKSGTKVKIEIKKINDLFKENRNKILYEILNPAELKNFIKENKAEAAKKKQLSKKAISPNEKPKRVFVLDFNGDITGSATTAFREQITAILQAAAPTDEIIVRLESPGGQVHAYGLASSQLARIREQKITLTICVDKVAASGGYMMACLANKIIAAPFAIIGSIGVIASMPNINKLLRKHEVEYLEMTAGEYKRTVTPFGEITEKGKTKLQEQIDEAHLLFKDHIKKYRDIIDINSVATGEYWYGTKAFEHKLIDEISTSDDYLLSLSKNYDIFHVFTPKKENMRDKILEMFNSLFASCLERLSHTSKFLT